jgi:predicted anti-sigma-YlaC factor YlaD
MNEERPCLPLLDHLSDYVDGAAAQTICAEIEQHLSGCENCRVVVDTLRHTVHLYHTLSTPTLPESARERLYKTLALTPYLVNRHED